MMSDVIRVLYVDDEPSLLDIGKLFLEKGGAFAIDTLTSAIVALDQVKTEPYDAIISDYQMPEMDGITFLKHLKASGNTTPFIIFTGRGREEVVIEALNSGADFYIQKGGDPKSQFAELEHKIRQAVMQRRAEVRIRDHERREADIINFLPDATFAVDTNGVVIAWNRAMEKMTRVKASEILGKGNYEYAVPFYHERRPILIDLVLMDDPAAVARYPYIKREGKTLTSEISIPHFNDGKGGILWFTASPLYDTQGNVVGAIESIREITGWKKAEEARYESDKRYRNVVEDQTEFISRFLPDGTHVFVNEAYCRYFGLKRDEILGHRFQPKIPVEDKERVKQFFASLTLEHPVDFIEHRIIMPDGTIRWQHWSDRAIFNNSGKVTEYQSVGRDITEVKATEAALRESENRFREQYQNNPLAIFTWKHREGDFVLVDCNNAAVTLTSGRSNHFLGKTVSELYATRPDLIAEIRKCFTERTKISKELISEHFLPGRRIHTTTAFIPPDLVLVHMEDITELKRAGEALKESEERLRSTLASMDDLVFTLDENGIFIGSYHPVMTTLYVTPEQFIGKSFRDILPKELSEQIQKAINNVKTTGATQQIEYSLFLNGKSSWFNTKISPRYSLEGTFNGVTVVARDVTDRKKAESALLESEKKFRSMVEASPDMIWEIDTQGIFTYISSQCSTQLGYAQDDLIGKPFVTLIQPQSANDIKKLFLTHVQEKDSFKTLEIPAKLRDGSPCIIEIRSLPILGNDGQINGFRGIAHDITERKKAEVALRQTNKKLNLLSSITRHDINNQMTVLQGYLSILKKKQPDATYNEYFQKVSTAAQRISSMIQFTKEYENIGITAPVWQDCRTLVDTTAKQAPLRQVMVKNDLLNGAEVFADQLIAKVFYNLIDNAVRYGGKITTIRFSVEEHEGDQIIVCEDDGVGVPAEEKEKIFKRGFGQNTGLGLALSREILDITGITLRETGEPGKGARFEMTVPKGAYRFGNVK